MCPIVDRGKQPVDLDMSYSAIVSQAGDPVHVHYDAPSDWSEKDVHDKLSNRGFRAVRSDDKRSVEVGVVDAPEPKLLQPGDEMPSVGGVSSGPQRYVPDGPSEFFPLGGTKDEVEEALKEVGFVYATASRPAPLRKE